MTEASDFDHLTTEAAALAALDDDQRLYAIRDDRWVDYPRAAYLLDTLNDLLTRPRTTRMPSIAIYADSGMGKTMLMQQFLSRHRATFDQNIQAERTPVLALQMTARPTEKRFYTQLLDLLGAPPTPRLGIADLEVIVLRFLRHVKARMLLIDETHNMLAASYSEQRAMLNLIRFLSNELQMSVVCFGVADAREAISGDAQLARRFREYRLPRWQADDAFQMLVIKILRNMPLRQPSILSPRGLKKILQSCDGVTAHIFTMLQYAAVLAVRTGQDYIDDALIAQVRTPMDAELNVA